MFMVLVVVNDMFEPRAECGPSFVVKGAVGRQCVLRVRVKRASKTAWTFIALTADLLR